MSSPESLRTDPSSDDPVSQRPSRQRWSADGQSGPEPASQEESGDRSRQSSPQPTPSPGDQFLGWTFRDFMIPYILLALSVQRAHGYVIEQYLRGLGLANVELSTLYRTLRQLEKNGLVSSTWEPGPEGPARRIYSLTDAGRWWLDAGAAALAGYRSIIDRFFGSYSGPVRGPEGDDTEKGASR